eukprot:CAMPEP_0116136028 /NCGR_PEP_ID=MMETSP0329-20121206/11503_1 /TAXON_ID=697910 /ORGANISM="Pseudo-nitzschia arenysensis, Strain B593" /LENGTH=627 /DNA_ID=CAMNT_0003630863 /DNA_START=76 /DNA_END=1959 /DNA_ORIENTATION=-
MRSRASGSNQPNPQNLSARANARKDPDGKEGVMYSATPASSSSTTGTLVANGSVSSATNVQSTKQQRKFALPGKAKPKRPLEFRPAFRRKHDPSGASSSSATTEGAASRSGSSSILPLVLAVILWYSLGVVSISSSKVLLTPYQGTGIDDQYLDDEYENHAIYQHVGGLPPLFLTLQQLLLGSTFLRLAIQFKLLGLTEGLVPLDSLLESLGSPRAKSPSQTVFSNPVLRYLVSTGIFFALGFLTTNMAFGAAAPTYVETLKAAEPITSAVFAVLWGIEVLTVLEILGLMGIVGGVLLSTTGSNHSASMAEGAGSPLLVATAIVMASNLCFSLRGLYQKLFRKGASEVRTQGEANGSLRRGKGKALDDLNLQFRMQQTGVLLLIIPTLVLNGAGVWKHAIGTAGSLSTPAFVKVLQQYALWSIGNGLAFSSYNLASTYLLTRISVVHHAAFNCTRRIFAIICTGLLFRIPVTLKSAIGIGISFVGFMVFTKAKAMKNQKTATKQQNVKSKKRDVPIGNGETPSSAANSNTILQEKVAANGQIIDQTTHINTNGSANYELGPPPSSSINITKTDFGTHRRANRNTTTTTSNFPLPPPPGNNRNIASPFPRSPPPPPPPPPPPAPRGGF